MGTSNVHGLMSEQSPEEPHPNPNPNLVITRPLHSKLFFLLTVTSLSFTLHALFRIFRSTQVSRPLESVKWQRYRMIGQAGIIGGLTGPLVWEGLGFDTWKLRAEREGRGAGMINENLSLNYLLGLFARNSETIYE